jgi:hypothetical protein
MAARISCVGEAELGWQPVTCVTIRVIPVGSPPPQPRQDNNGLRDLRFEGSSQRSASTMARTRIWTRTLAIQVGIVLAAPVILGFTVGFFELNPEESEMLSGVGDDSHLLLNSFPDNTLTVEIAYQQSLGPPPSSAVSTLLDRINETCSKASVSVDEHGFASTATTFSDSDLTTLDQQLRQNWPAPGSMSLFYLYLNGAYAPDNSVIGLAFRASSVAVFEGTIDSDSSLFGDSTAVTTTVMIHEFGHELGLVGIFGHVPNEDLSHPPHSNDPNDVMYWAVDTTQIALLGATPPTQFDAADMNDLSMMKDTLIPYEALPWVVLAIGLAAAAGLVYFDLRRRRRELRSE